MRILCLIIAMFLGAAHATDRTAVRITIKQDGHLCEVQTQVAECVELPALLNQEFGVDRDLRLTVSPEACGAAALAIARGVAAKLRAAGYMQVFVVGFISEPNRQCASG